MIVGDDDFYVQFLASKLARAVPTGIDGEFELSPKLKRHQRALTAWALRRGRAGIFAATGLGKGWMILEWSRVVSEYTGKPAIIFAPLAVSQQFAREAEKLGVGITVCSQQSDVRAGINVTNYQKLHKFDAASFGSVAIDEGSILKHLDGKTRALLIESFQSTPFRLSATATPSPNDHTELGGQAEFLGIMRHQEMLASFFIRDGGSTQDWRLKGHARDVFWRWVCQWAALVRMPSDISCPDDGYILPPLVYHEHIIPAGFEDAHKAGMLFPEPADTLIEQRAARRGTIDSRVAKAAEIANASKDQMIVWCDLNAESQALTKAINGAVEITGSQTDDEKEAALEKFVTGRARVAVSKSSLMGFGLNLQFARTAIFCGVTHSFEAFFQAIRRQWRFGVTGDVNVHIISSELEGAVVSNLKSKMKADDELALETRKYVADYVSESVLSMGRERATVKPTIADIKWPRWLKTEREAV